MLALGACSYVAVFPQERPGVRIADAKFGRAYSKRTERVEVPFALAPRGVNATVLVLKYLDAARAAGAKYVSDLSISLEFWHDGIAVECVSTMVIDDGRPRRPVTAAIPIATAPPPDTVEYTTDIAAWSPATVEAKVDDRELVCRKEIDLVNSMEPRYASRHDIDAWRYIAPGQMPMDHVGRAVEVERCGIETQRKAVRRYAHYVAAKLTPVDWTRIARDYSDWPLMEGPPVCHEIDLSRRAPRHGINGNFHFVGSLGRTAKVPDALAR